MSKPTKGQRDELAAATRNLLDALKGKHSVIDAESEVAAERLRKALEPYKDKNND